jgi:hypothetical protein
LAGLAVVWPIAALASAGTGNDADAQHAARLLSGTRAAAEQRDFTGVASVVWTTPKGARRASVDVTDAHGNVAVTAADGGAVVDQGDRTYLRDQLGWTGLVVEPPARDLPSPARRWRLSTAGSQTVAGRAATVVVAARADGIPAQRLTVDDATGLLLGREVLGPRGALERSVRFSSIDLQPVVAGISPPAGARTPSAESLTTVPDGYHAPTAPAGFQLLTRSRHPDGVLLFYGDGVFTASVFEQQGQLEWDSLPSGGTETQLADTRTRTYHEPSGDVAVWTRDGLVYTCVTDGPSDVFARMIGALASDGRSAPQSIVDYVLGPFGWG